MVELRCERGYGPESIDDAQGASFCVKIAGVFPVQMLMREIRSSRTPFQMSGTWHLSEQLNPAPDNGTPPLVNTPLTFTSGAGHSYYANDPCFTATWPDAAGQTDTIVVSVFVSPRGLLLTGYRTAGTYQQSLVSRIANDTTAHSHFALGTWTDTEGRTGIFDLAPS
jgi:hypothetical protein